MIKEYKWHLYSPAVDMDQVWFYEPDDHKFSQDQLYGAVANTFSSTELIANLNNAGPLKTQKFPLDKVEEAKLWIENQFQLYVLSQL